MKTLAIALLLLCMGTACTTTKQYEIRSVNGTHSEWSNLITVDAYLVRVDLATGSECAVGTVPFFPTQQGHYIYQAPSWAAVVIPACTK